MLTSRDNVKNYLASQTAAVDQLIDRLIARESRTIEAYCARSFAAGVTKTRFAIDGSGSDVLVLPELPIVSVSAVSIGDCVVSPSSDGVAAGFVNDELAVILIGGQKFPRGRRNVFVTWQAGYQASWMEAIPGGAASSITPRDGFPLDPVSVIAADGTVFTKVAATPTAGQYTFDALTGSYGFNTADKDKIVTLLYWGVPAPVEQACIEMVCLDLKQRDNLGISSKSIAGESVSFTSKGMTDSVKEMLQPFRRRWLG